MLANTTEWDNKHRLAAAEGKFGEPASIVRELLPLLPPGPALDLACGLGRHTLLLAARGQRVVAVDASTAALNGLEARARSANLTVHRHAYLKDAASSSKGGVQLVQADLEEISIPANSFQLILCFQYLQRSLFRSMEHALTPGGLLLFETFTRAQLEFSGGPRNPDFLLDRGELHSAFPSLHSLFYRELRAGQGIASLAAQRPDTNRNRRGIE
jgi:SAM-dependent methyltransferase